MPTTENCKIYKVKKKITTCNPTARRQLIPLFSNSLIFPLNTYMCVCVSVHIYTHIYKNI